MPNYTEREKKLITGEIKPDNNSEWGFVQNNAEAMIPGDDGLRHSRTSKPTEPPLASDFQQLKKDPPQGFCPPTYVSMTEEAMDRESD